MARQHPASPPEGRHSRWTAPHLGSADGGETSTEAPVKDGGLPQAGPGVQRKRGFWP